MFVAKPLALFKSTLFLCALLDSILLSLLSGSTNIPFSLSLISFFDIKELSVVTSVIPAKTLPVMRFSVNSRLLLECDAIPTLLWVSSFCIACKPSVPVEKTAIDYLQGSSHLSLYHHHLLHKFLLGIALLFLDLRS